MPSRHSLQRLADLIERQYCIDLGAQPARLDQLIALEEAFWYDKLATDGSPLSHVPVKPDVIAGWQRLLPDFTEFRLPEMDKYGVDMQVLSLTSPGIQMQPDPEIAVADARTANDFLATVISAYPRRFAGLAAIPLQDPERATVELRRAVGTGVFDRFPGARIILGHMGKFLPFQLSRIDARYADLNLRQPLGKLPSEYFGPNIAITTTGVFSHGGTHRRDPGGRH